MALASLLSVPAVLRHNGYIAHCSGYEQRAFSFKVYSVWVSQAEALKAQALLPLTDPTCSPRPSGNLLCGWASDWVCDGRGAGPAALVRGPVQGWAQRQVQLAVDGKVLLDMEHMPSSRRPVASSRGDREQYAARPKAAVLCNLGIGRKGSAQHSIRISVDLPAPGRELWRATDQTQT